MFDYSFTKLMEEKLDFIKDDSSNWSNICMEMYSKLKHCVKNISLEDKQEYVLDDSNTMQFLQFGPVIKHLNKLNGKYEYLPIKKNLKLDNEKLKKNMYSTSELAEFPDSFIGNYNLIPVNVMIGKFGPYLRYDSVNYQIDDTSLTLENAIDIITTKKLKDSSKTILRFIDSNTSVRKGKDGKPYVFYKTKEMIKPVFYNIKDFNLLFCEPKIIINCVRNAPKYLRREIIYT
jgi:Topoisomerase C-terminal repeat